MGYNIIAGLDGIKREIELLLDSPADPIRATAEAQPAPRLHRLQSGNVRHDDLSWGKVRR